MLFGLLFFFIALIFIKYFLALYLNFYNDMYTALFVISLVVNLVVIIQTLFYIELLQLSTNLSSVKYSNTIPYSSILFTLFLFYCHSYYRYIYILEPFNILLYSLLYIILKLKI